MLPDSSLVPSLSVDEVSPEKIQCVDVRTEEAFTESHIPGAQNFCVYETVFVEKIEKAFPDKNESLLLIGQGGGFKADLVAWSRLHSAGYTGVQILAGGLTSWKQSGRALEESPAAPESPEGRYRLDPEASRIYWTGRNLLNQHSGTIEADSGELELDADGTPLQGSVVVDMTRMHCEDLEDPGMAQMLIGHLASVDFFAVADHPQASFHFKEARAIDGSTPGSPNFRIQGTLSVRGQDVPLDIEALVAETEGGMVLKAVFDFDRTLLGAVYGSGRFFERLGMHMVQDLVSMDVRCIFHKR